MTETDDIRWQQRFANYRKALAQLSKFIEKSNLNELEEQGLVQAFEYTHELAWKSLKDLLMYKGVENVHGSRDASRYAFKEGWLGNSERDGEIWMDMIKSRNLTSHTYNEEVLKQITEAIKQDYYPAFMALEQKLSELL